MFNGMMEGVVLGMGRIDGNLRLLDVTDNMERSVGLANTKGYRELATSSVRMDGECCISGGDQLWSISCVEGRS